MALARGDSTRFRLYRPDSPPENSLIGSILKRDSEDYGLDHGAVALRLHQLTCHYTRLGIMSEQGPRSRYVNRFRLYRPNPPRRNSSISSILKRDSEDYGLGPRAAALRLEQLTCLVYRLGGLSSNGMATQSPQLQALPSSFRCPSTN